MTSSSPFQTRAFISVLMTVCFVLVMTSGLVLFFGPQSRGAGWTLLALGRGSWLSLHIVFGIVFLFAGLSHLWLNRKPLASYLAVRLTRTPDAPQRVIKPETLAAIILCTLLFAGSIYRTFPLNLIWELRDAIRG